MESVKDYGGQYAVLTVQAGCGFDLWPSNVSFPWGGRYNCNHTSTLPTTV